MALCELEEVKLYLGMTVTTNDTLLEMLIDSASSYIESYTNRIFEIQEYTEIINGTGTNRLPVSYAPIFNVNSVTSIYGIGVTPQFTKNLIYLTDGTIFTEGKMNWTVNYEAGFEEIPYDVRQACIDMVAFKYKEKDRIGINTKTLAGEVISFEKRDLKDHIRSLLANYIRVC